MAAAVLHIQVAVVVLANLKQAPLPFHRELLTHIVVVQVDLPAMATQTVEKEEIPQLLVTLH